MARRSNPPVSKETLTRAQRRVVRHPAIARGLGWSWKDLTDEAMRRTNRPPLLMSYHINEYYWVQGYIVPGRLGMRHLMIRRHDGRTDIPWADFQRIKDELVGPDRIAVQVHPSTARLVDDCDVFHLWVYPEGHSMGFGLHPYDLREGAKHAMHGQGPDQVDQASTGTMDIE